jgi:nucleotide-binding universal stress UspA family protein
MSFRLGRALDRTVRNRMRLATGALVALCAACGSGGNGTPTEPTSHSRLADVAAGVAQAAAAVTGQTSPLADNYEKGTYAGFDTHTYPGTSVMRTWKNTPGSQYTWVGYYLPSPCHADKSWTGKRDTIQAMGWGVAVVYVGQQTWGKTPRSLSPAQRAAVRKKSSCSQDLMSAAEGTANADDATARAAAEGFAPGIVVFLDLERVEKVPPVMRDYYRAWVARMLADGKYTPGIYTHEHNASEIFADVQAVFKAAGDTTTPRFWIAGGKGFDEGRAPQDVGFAFAGMWQGVLDVVRSVANIRLPVDVNVGAWRSPSESDVPVQ